MCKSGAVASAIARSYAAAIHGKFDAGTTFGMTQKPRSRSSAPSASARRSCGAHYGACFRIHDAPGLDPAPVALLLRHRGVAIVVVETPGRAQHAYLAALLIALLGEPGLAVPPARRRLRCTRRSRRSNERRFAALLHRTDTAFRRRTARACRSRRAYRAETGRRTPTRSNACPSSRPPRTRLASNGPRDARAARAATLARGSSATTKTRSNAANVSQCHTPRTRPINVYCSVW